MTSVYDCDYL